MSTAAWRAMTPEQAADKFCIVLRNWLTTDQLDTVVERNKTPEYAQACATHDFCDANVAMLEALGDPEGISFDDDAFVSLINRAWDIARAADFSLGEDASDEEIADFCTAWDLVDVTTPPMHGY